ncbi:MAG: hypothetical protein JNJ70_06515 [Verrucomicrobiales bacterium]|nr:hypothetical protein [Verrucomicrobiales bacterium]
MKIRLLLASLLALLAIPAKAELIVTYAEDPSLNQSSLGGTQVFDFNTMSIGYQKNVSWKGVGTFDQLYINKADAYGGAADATNPKGSLYSVQGAGTPVTSSTLQLDIASSYFGMWWSAGDPRNVLSFYSGEKLVGTFTTSSLLNLLPSTYDGNPINRKINSGEPYAFINFYGDEKTTWDRIVLTNDGSSGFESDNYTTRVAAWDPAKDGALGGVPVAIVSGTTTTAVTEETLAETRWALDETSVASVPAAPAPPLALLAAFAAVFAMRRFRSAATTA